MSTDDHNQNSAPASSRGRPTMAEGPRRVADGAHAQARGEPRSTAPWRMGKNATSSGAEPPRGPEVPGASARRTPLVPDAIKQPGQRYVGSTVDGRYVVEKLLSRGGMGAVYLCRRTVIDKVVAMKVLRPEFMHDPETTERFIIEAKAASAIGSPHIVEVFDFGTMPDGCTYFVMEYLDGDSLASVLHREQRLASERVISIAQQIAEGLAVAHDVDIVHRDLKPDNVVLIERGKQEFVKILDFGLAKMARGQGRLTRVGKVFGTPHYMSPEQARGKPVDRRSDVYSLGVILYEMLTGRVPFDGDTPMSILSGHVHGDVPPLRVPGASHSGAMPELEYIVLKCLAKQPRLRYASMRALAEDLDLVALGQKPVYEVGPPSAPEIETSAEVEALLAAVDDWEEGEHVLIDADDEGDATVVDDRPPPKPSDEEVDEEGEATVVDSSIPFSLSNPPPAAAGTSDSGLDLLSSFGGNVSPAPPPRVYSEPPDSLPSDDGWEPDSEASPLGAAAAPTRRRLGSLSLWPLALAVVLLIGLVLALASQVARQIKNVAGNPPAIGGTAPVTSSLAALPRAPAGDARSSSAPAVSVTATPAASVSLARAPGEELGPAPTPTPAPSASATPAFTRDVVVEFVPSDVEVFVNGVNRGASPVTVQVTRGHPVRIEARREGYWRRLFWIDTSKARVRMAMPPKEASRPEAGGGAKAGGGDAEAGAP